MDFLQFINHIQKKITGSNRVHGIGQGHNSAGTGPTGDQTAPLGYFNADMVDGLHARTTGVNLDSAYIPVANSQENPNLAAQLLLATLKRPNVQGDTAALHKLEMNDYDAGLQRFENADLKWRINSYAHNDRLWVSDDADFGKIEPPRNNAVFFGNSIGIRGWTASNSGALYLGAGQGGGFWSWSYTGTGDNDPDAKVIINTDGTIEGSSIAEGSVPYSKLKDVPSTIPNATNATNATNASCLFNFSSDVSLVNDSGKTSTVYSNTTKVRISVFSVSSLDGQSGDVGWTVISPQAVIAVGVLTKDQDPGNAAMPYGGVVTKNYAIGLNSNSFYTNSSTNGGPDYVTIVFHDQR